MFRRVSGGSVAWSLRASPRSSRSEISARAWRMNGQLRVQRRVRRARARQRVAREPSYRRQRGVQRDQRGAALAEHVAQLGHGGAQVGLLAREPGDGVVEVGDQLAQLLRVARQRAEHPALAAQQPAQVVGLLPARGVGHLGAVAVGVLPVPDGLVEAARTRALQRAGVLLEQRPQVLAGLGLQRGQHLVELHRRGRLLGRKRRPAGQLGRARRPRAQLDEVVALQEQARAHLELGVLVDRQAGVVDLHGHARVARAVLQRLDRLDLPHVHARDPHRRALGHAVGVGEHGLQLVGAGERVGLGEGEERAQAHHQHGDQAGRERPHAGALGAAAGNVREPHGTSLRLSMPSSRDLKVPPARPGRSPSRATLRPPSSLRP